MLIVKIPDKIMRMLVNNPLINKALFPGGKRGIGGVGPLDSHDKNKKLFTEQPFNNSSTWTF